METPAETATLEMGMEAAREKIAMAGALEMMEADMVSAAIPGTGTPVKAARGAAAELSVWAAARATGQEVRRAAAVRAPAAVEPGEIPGIGPTLRRAGQARCRGALSMPQTQRARKRLTLIKNGN